MLIYLHNGQYNPNEIVRVAKLTDFSQSREVDMVLADPYGSKSKTPALSQSWTVSTPGYRSPEVLSRTAYDPFAIDAWAVGVLVFFVFELYRPVSCTANRLCRNSSLSLSAVLRTSE